ncbi:MAG TPA: RyR domain-containing protein [Caulobacteraceae bacterium]|nr:RyR domain-containing protein [Caulobacteraceae bacterium]
MQQRGGGFPLRIAWAIPAAALLTLALGIWGWSGRHLPLDEALYRSIALFEIDNDTYSHGLALLDWRFRVGRWTGAGVVFSGLVALGALLRQHLATALARWTKQAVVVIGADAVAVAAFERARRGRRSALWLGAPGFDSASFTAIALAWPPSDRARAVFDHAGGADHVLIAAEKDAEALAFARSARAAAPGARITVLMRDVRLAEDAAAALNDARTRVLSRAALAARALALAHSPFRIARDLGHARIHALIVGFGQTGQAIARDLIVNCRTTYLDLPRLTIVDPAAGALEGVLRVRAPEIDACAQIRCIEGEIGGLAVRPGPEALAAAVAEAGPITAAYVCLATDTEALAAVSVLQSLLRALDLEAPPIFVRLGEASPIAAPAGDRGPGAPTAFGDLATILEASEFLADAPDAAARDFNEAYRASLAPERRDDPLNRSARPWDGLDETYRQANRDAVAHVPAKLASAGVDPARWTGLAAGLPRLAPGERLYRTAAELEALAELEHERWLAQRRMDGWRRTPTAAKDEARRLHPSLIPYAELSEALKEFDRVYVRQTERACGGPGGARPELQNGT